MLTITFSHLVYFSTSYFSSLYVTYICPCICLFVYLSSHCFLIYLLYICFFLFIKIYCNTTTIFISFRFSNWKSSV